MSKTTKVVLWSITAFNLAVIAYFLMKPAEAASCYPLPQNNTVCVQTDAGKVALKTTTN